MVPWPPVGTKNRWTWKHLFFVMPVAGACVGPACASAPQVACSADAGPQTAVSVAEPASSWWKPGPIKQFQIFHFGSLEDFKRKLKKQTEVVTLDLDQMEDNGGAAVVGHAHAQGTKVICYVSQGYEKWRDDIKDYPCEAMGDRMKDWDGELWSDPRKESLLAFQAKRMDRCKALGADGIELDNMDQHDKDNIAQSGIDLSENENVAAQARFAKLAHDKGLAIIAKNGSEVAAQLAPLYDGVWIEHCARHQECNAFAPYKGKPVVMLEYNADCFESDWSTCQKKAGYFEPE